MPGENIQDWSTTAANNDSADTLINWREGQARASVNDSARSMMAAHAKNRNLQNGSIITTGTANAQSFVSGVGYTAVPTGLRVLLKIGVSNTGPTTLNMDGIGAVTIKDQNGSNLLANDLTLGNYAEFRYDGTNWVLLFRPRGGEIPSGTYMLFHQTAAPTGWTKQIAHNDKVLRVTTGTVSTGGVYPFTSIFTNTIQTSEWTLSTNQIPSHTHSMGYLAVYDVTGSGNAIFTSTPADTNTGATGGGASHSHLMDLRIQYVDVIIASKD